MPDSLPLVEQLNLVDWFAWGAGHVDEMDDVIDAATTWAATPAVPVRGKWEATKALGDNVVAVIEDAPPFQHPGGGGDAGERLTAAELRFDGSRLRKFVEALPKIIAFIEKLKPILDAFA